MSRITYTIHRLGERKNWQENFGFKIIASFPVPCYSQLHEECKGPDISKANVLSCRRSINAYTPIIP